jgi:SAM-dependent methyltransferase
MLFALGAEMDPDRSQFYTGIIAEYYDLLVPDDEAGSFWFFRQAIESHGEPALEVGCGTGRPLLAYLEAGLDVEGLDASAEMLEICRRKARERGLRAKLHHQRMETFEIDRRFGTIFIVNSSFMLLPDRAAARGALERMFRHLRPSGRVLISLDIPVEPPAVSDDRWHTVRAAVRSDGTTIRCLGRTLRFDTEAQVYETTLLYQLERGGRIEQEEERPLLLRWYTEDQFTALLAEVGFTAIRSTRATADPSTRAASEPPTRADADPPRRTGSGLSFAPDREFVIVAERPPLPR